MVELQPLGLEQGLLQRDGIRVGPAADGALGVHDPVPGNVRPCVPEGVPGQPGLTRVPRQFGHLPVGRDPPARDPPDHGQNGAVAGVGSRHGRPRVR